MYNATAHSTIRIALNKERDRVSNEKDTINNSYRLTCIDEALKYLEETKDEHFEKLCNSARG